jgi:hypothetical protein
MKRLIAVILCLLWVSTAFAFQPRSGTWANLQESGRAFNIDIQDGLMIMIVYAYQAGGAPQWYLASGAMTNGGHSFTGTLDKYQGGQCITCSFAGPPTLIGNDGVISVNFSNETNALVTLPGGRTTAIQPFNFGIGDPPLGLLGEWIFVYDIVAGGTTAARYDFTAVASSTSNGNGLVVDATRFAFCELQISGALAGNVVCVDWTDSALTTVANLYQFRFSLDQTYAGFWVSPADFTMYSMQGFKVISRSGISRSSTSPIDGPATTREGTPTRVAAAQSQCGAMQPMADTAAARVVTEMRQVLCAGH